MHFGALIADANSRTRGEWCGLPPTWLSATACDWLEYSCCRRNGQGTPDECPPTLRLVVVFLFFFALCFILVHLDGQKPVLLSAIVRAVEFELQMVDCLELSADGPQTAGLVIQPFQTVAEDIFVWSLAQKCSVNSHLVAL